MRKTRAATGSPYNEVDGRSQHPSGVESRRGESSIGVVKAVCPLDCPDTCSMRVTVEDGVAVDLRGDPEHPFTRGFLCQKMARYLDRVYSPDRLLHPLRRVGPKGSGRFERICWDEALAEIAERFAAIAGSADGPQAILPYSYYGTMGKLQASSLDRRFFHRLGRLDARPDHLRLGRLGRLRVHHRPGPAGGRPDGACPAASSSSTGARTPPTPTATSGA